MSKINPNSKKSKAAPTPKRVYPPIYSCVGDVPGWIRKVSSSSYRRKIKRAVELTKTYRLRLTGNSHLSRRDIDALHELYDTMTFENERRARGNNPPIDIMEGVA